MFDLDNNYGYGFLFLLVRLGCLFREGDVIEGLAFYSYILNSSIDDHFL